MIHRVPVEADPRLSKPRASGDDPADDVDVDAGALVNPARAGMIPADITAFSPRLSKPRASGDDPCTVTMSRPIVA